MASIYLGKSNVAQWTAQWTTQWVGAGGTGSPGTHILGVEECGLVRGGGRGGAGMGLQAGGALPSCVVEVGPYRGPGRAGLGVGVDGVGGVV